MENYASGREKRRQLLLMLCQYEADRLDVWAQPTNTKYITIYLSVSDHLNFVKCCVFLVLSFQIPGMYFQRNGFPTQD